MQTFYWNVPSFEPFPLPPPPQNKPTNRNKNYGRWKQEKDPSPLTEISLSWLMYCCGVFGIQAFAVVYMIQRRVFTDKCSCWLFDPVVFRAVLHLFLCEGGRAYVTICSFPSFWFNTGNLFSQGTRKTATKHVPDNDQKQHSGYSSFSGQQTECWFHASLPDTLLFVNFFRIQPFDFRFVTMFVDEWVTHVTQVAKINLLLGNFQREQCELRVLSEQHF